MLKTGDIAPNFSLLDQADQQVQLSDLLSAGPVILFFYPADFTPVCTRQACMFRDIFDELKQVGVQVAGISGQSTASHEKFRQAQKLPYRLLYDPQHKVAQVYGAMSILSILPRRVSYLIGRDGKILDRVVADFRIKPHREMAERALKSSSVNHPAKDK